MEQKIFGDFQTPQSLANRIVNFLNLSLNMKPTTIIEPTAGLGNFLYEAHSVWGDQANYYGFDINHHYIKKMSKRFEKNLSIHIEEQDFFQYKWNILQKKSKDDILILGNPPWVTNSTLSSLNANNLPTKKNFQGLQGFEAKTGKANFDIAEWIIIKMVEEWATSTTNLAMLCKTSTARKTLMYFWKSTSIPITSSIYLFDAQKEFNVAVDACLLIININPKKPNHSAKVYKDFSTESLVSTFGLINNELISDINRYQKYKKIDGKSSLIWRSGVKHDASKVMELVWINGQYTNGLNEVVDIEDTYIYPLLKSSDLGNARLQPRKYVIVTQRKVGEDTASIQNMAPKTWKYLKKHQEKLNARKSSIYINKPCFSIFGIGEYSFAPWKVAISGMYKNLSFQLLSPYNDKPIMLDDTCNFLYFNTEQEAIKIYKLLTSEICLNFLKSLIFFDAKRPINIDILNRINLEILEKFLLKIH